MQRNHVHISLAIPRSNTTIVCHNRNQLWTKIKMSSYSFQDVYNHVCWICHPIKHERHYPDFLPRARWHVDIQSEQKDWAHSVPAVIRRLWLHKHWPRFCRKTHKQTCTTVLFFEIIIYGAERHLSGILHWFVITHQRQSIKNNYIGQRHTSVWTKSPYNDEHLWHSFLLMP